MSAIPIGVADSVRLVGVVGERRKGRDLDSFGVDRRRPWDWRSSGRLVG
jgi:hypothetical protein